jgi:hypothetical protein
MKSIGLFATQDTMKKSGRQRQKFSISIIGYMEGQRK